MIAIGDSHTQAFEPYCRTVELPGPTAFHIEKHDADIRRNLEHGINLFVFGEIDCRIHIYYQYEKRNRTVSMNDLMETTADVYLSYVSGLRDRGHDVWVLSVPPAGTEQNRYEYPHYAPYDVRLQINRTFNGILERFCGQFVSYFEETCDADGRLEEYVEDDVHLNSRAAAIIMDKLGSVA